MACRGFIMHKTVLMLFAAVVFVGGCAAENKIASKQLEQLFKDDWAQGLKDNPLFATSYGDHRFDDKLPKVSLAEVKRGVEQEKVFLNRLLKIDRTKLTEQEQISYDMFKRNSENGIKGYEFQTYLMPINQMGGFYIDFPQLPERLTFKTMKDYENYIARIKGFKAYTQGYIELMREGIKKGIVLPKIVMGKICGSIEAQIVSDAQKSPLYTPFEKFPKTISEQNQQRLCEEGKKAISESVVPAYEEFLKFVKEEYVPAGRENISVSSLPNGKAYYQFCVRNSTTLDDVTAEQVHQIGLAEVKRIREEMLDVMKKVDFKGDFKQFVEYLRNDKRFYASEPNELFKDAAYCAKRIDGELPRFFAHLPRMPFGLKAVPAYSAAAAAAAYYEPPTPDGTNAAFFYMNTYNMKIQPLYRIEALVCHETNPGHHLQISLAQEIKGLPKFRKYSGYGAYTEGWALYAEKLGQEMGLYKDVYSDFGRLDMEMWRSCRLVVDTGIHYYGWSRQQAIDFMAENTSLDKDYIATEVERYIVWPGQALTYKMGQLKISELRKMAEEKLGEKFDIREFHDAVLRNGAVPLTILENNVKKWVEEKQ